MPEHWGPGPGVKNSSNMDPDAKENQEKDVYSIEISFLLNS